MLNLCVFVEVPDVCFVFLMFQILLWSHVHEKRKGINTAADSVHSQAGRCCIQRIHRHLTTSLAQLIRTETLSTLEKAERKTEVREQALPSSHHGNLSVRIATINVC
ncbi:hypothetical protein TNCV_3658801 [Trichonephila clavipes]|nr:hypothetical protein TNCV_3658801 [Trichonephila clavipes]